MSIQILSTESHVASVGEPVGAVRPDGAGAETVPIEVRAFDADLTAALGGDATGWGDSARRWGTTYQQLPEYAQLHLRRPEVPLRLPGFWLTAGETQAVLLPKRLPVGRTVDTVAGGMAGYWLAGNGVFGPSAAERLLSFLDAASATVRRERAAFLLIEDVDLDSPLHIAVRELTRQGWSLFSPTGWQPRWRIELPPNGEEYWAKFNSKRRGNLRRQQRKLGGEVRRYTEVDRVGEFLSLAHTVSLKSWQTRAIGLRVGNSAFEQSAYRLASAEGRFRSYVLVKDGQPISFAIGTTATGRFLLEEIGYDPAFAEWSPGMTLLCHMLDDFYVDRPPTLFDFGGGDAAYKRTLANRETQSATLWLIAPGLRRQSAMRLFEWVRAARKQTRRFLGEGGLRARLRRMFRTGNAAQESTTGGMTADQPNQGSGGAE